MDLEDPVADLAVPVRPAHRLVAARRDVGLDVLARDLLVRELPQQVPGDGTAERPPIRLGQPGHVRVQLLAGDVLVRLEELAARAEHDRQRVPQPQLDRVVAEHVGPAEVGLPLLEDGPEVQEHDVVRCDRPVRRVLAVRLQGVRPGPDDPLVPVPVHPEHLRGQVPDRFARLGLAHARRDDAVGFHGGEQLDRLGLRLHEPGGAHALVLDHPGPTSPSQRPAPSAAPSSTGRGRPASWRR